MGYKFDDKEFVGYFGHIELARPMFHMGYIDKVRMVLQCVCFDCGTLLIDEKDPTFHRIMNEHKRSEDRLKEFTKICRGKKKCYGGDDLNEDMEETGGKEVIRRGCGAKQPKISKPAHSQLSFEYDNEEDLENDLGAGGRDRKQMLQASHVNNIFKQISEKDMRALGFHPKWSRPEWLLWHVMPVPPPHVSHPCNLVPVLVMMI